MENNYLKLADIPTGEECVIVKVHGHGSFRNRIVEMGFVRGEKVTVIKNAPLHDPIEYKLMDGHISLRRSEARLIEVVCTSSIDQEGYNGTFTEDEIAREISEKSRTINIALVGNPNCSHLFWLQGQEAPVFHPPSSHDLCHSEASFHSFRFRQL